MRRLEPAADALGALLISLDRRRRACAWSEEIDPERTWELPRPLPATLTIEPAGYRGHDPYNRGVA